MAFRDDALSLLLAFDTASLMYGGRPSEWDFSIPDVVVNETP
jgi:hypothetical protein